MHRPTILVAGHITHDRYAGGITPGGSAFYAAQVYRHLDADVRVATTVGRDFAFDERLSNLGSCHVTKDGQTTVFDNIYPEHGPRIQLIEAVAPVVDPAALAPEFLRADVVHLAPIMGEIDIAIWRRFVCPKILAVSVQGWVRRVGAPVDVSAVSERAGQAVAEWVRGHHVEHAVWQVGSEHLAGVDVAFLSHEDLAGQDGLLDRLIETCSLVVLTNGRDGCTVLETSGYARSAGALHASDPGESNRSHRSYRPNEVIRRTHVGVYPTREMEATGAGDTFAAGFLFLLACGESPVEAARFGAAVASIAIEGMGASPLGRVGEAWSRVESIPIDAG